MDAQFITGHPGIDKQHEALFAIIDKVRTSPHHEFADDIQTALDLIKYVVQHFAFEENLMIRSAYPGAVGHLENHRKISDAVNAYKDRLLNGEDAHAELATFIDTWIRHHIGLEDRRLAEHIAARGGATALA